MIESSIEQAFVRWCKNRNIICVKLQSLGASGWPDRCVLLPDNKVLWLEFKTKNGRIRKQQKLIHALLALQGHEVFIARSKEDAVTRLSDVCEKLSSGQAPDSEWGRFVARLRVGENSGNSTRDS